MSLNITDNPEFKREWEMLMAPETIKVSVKVKWIGKICIPDNEGKEEATAVFRLMTCEKYWEIEQDCSKMEIVPDGEIKTTDYPEMRKQILRRMLLKWSLDMPLEFDDNGNLSDDCFSKVIKLPSPLISTFVGKYEDSINVGDDEIEKAERQAAILFRSNRGVENACKSVSLYCTLSNFWDKFGLNRDDMRNLSYREYVMLRIMVAKETEATVALRGDAKDHTRAGKYTKVMGQGGRIHQSQGQVIPG
jgi:hypothetical protein